MKNYYDINTIKSKLDYIARHAATNNHLEFDIEREFAMLRDLIAVIPHGTEEEVMEFFQQANREAGEGGIEESKVGDYVSREYAEKSFDVFAGTIKEWDWWNDEDDDDKDYEYPFQTILLSTTLYYSEALDYQVLTWDWEVVDEYTDTK